MTVNIETDIGKQAKDVAEAAETSVDTVIKAAGFLDTLFGNAITNSIGLLGDKLAYYRLEKAIELKESVDKKLKARGVKKRYVPVSFGLPIIEKATIEEEPCLQEKWANLLANAHDASFSKPLRRNFSSILSDLEVIDAKVLDILVEEYLATTDKPNLLFDKELIIKNQNIPPREAENVIRNLMRLGLVKPGVITGNATMGGHNISAYKDTDLFGITALGVDFFYAVNDKP